MNTYRTPHMRTAPQVTQRRFDVVASGVKRTLHGVKGGNGEWMLSLYTSEGWVEGWGTAVKDGPYWYVGTRSGSNVSRTLSGAIGLALIGGE